MLEKVKKALRIISNDLDSEILDIVEACKLDLGLAGISYIDESDPLITRAIVLYAKIHASFSAENYRFQQSYDMLKCSLALSGEYKQAGGEADA